MKAYKNSVKFTGADSGSTLIGLGEVNSGLKIKVNSNQLNGHGGRVHGTFTIIDAGNGSYSDAQKNLKISQF